MTKFRINMLYHIYSQSCTCNHIDSTKNKNKSISVSWASFRFNQRLMNQKSGMWNSSTKPFNAGLAASISWSNILVQLIKDQQKLIVFWHMSNWFYGRIIGIAIGWWRWKWNARRLWGKWFKTRYLIPTGSLILKNNYIGM